MTETERKQLLGEDAFKALVAAELASTTAIHPDDGGPYLHVRENHEAAAGALSTLEPFVAALVKAARAEERERIVAAIFAERDAESAKQTAVYRSDYVMGLVDGHNRAARIARETR